jgi:hypothetical protein
MKRGNLPLRLCSAGLLALSGLVSAFPQGQRASAGTVMPALVRIPALVFDKHQMGQELSDQEKHCVVTDLESLRNLGHEEPYFPKDCDQSIIHGLTAKDFHIFEDGVEQKILSVSAESWAMTVRDNYRMHSEFSLTPAGRWSTPGPGGVVMLGLSVLANQFLGPRVYGADSSRPVYWIAYAPSNPQEEGCGRIKVEVDRPDSRVFAWDRSCAGQSPADPLEGTKFGRGMWKKLESRKAGKLKPLLQAGAFCDKRNDSRVNVSFELRREDLVHDSHGYGSKHWKIGIMGGIYRKDGSLATHFSDIACCTSFAPESGGAAPEGDFGSFLFTLGRESTIPTRYETQIKLPPGEYVLKVGFDDEERFGKAEMPLTIPPYDGSELGISSVMLCKRYRDAHVAAVERKAANFAPQYVPLVSRGIEFTPAGDTTFSKKQGEPLIPYFEVYEPLLASQPETKVEAHVRILNVKTGAVVKDFPPVDAGSYENPGSITIPIAREIPYDKLPKGEYRLEVQATDSAGRSTAVRTADFAVE